MPYMCSKKSWDLLQQFRFGRRSTHVAYRHQRGIHEIKPGGNLDVCHFSQEFFRAPIQDAALTATRNRRLRHASRGEHCDGRSPYPSASSTQFSIRKFGTRLNSPSLFVTSVAPALRAWAAISKSFAPMIRPSRVSASRISP